MTMAILKIITEPDPRFAQLSPRLRQKSARIEKIDDEVRALAADLLETMFDANGVGLAAPQVGIYKRLIVIHVPAGYDNEDDPEVTLQLVNPEILKAGGREVGIEGCLSFPDMIGEVPRYATVNVRAQDLEGNTLRIKTRGILARVLQHEIDHLDGVLFIDRMDDWTTLGYPPRPEDRHEEPETETAEVTAPSMAD
jgi:peptide deformylase